MKVLVAGATGAMGRPLVRLLRARGHQVIAMTRHESKRGEIAAAGAAALVVDALDADRLVERVVAAAPTHVVHLLTAIPAHGTLRPRDLAPTNRLRREGTRNLLRAAVAAGAGRLVAESFFGVYGAAAFDRPLDESATMVPAQGTLAEAVLALRDLEGQLLAAREAGSIETVALRFGLVYGPDVPSTIGLVEQLRRRRVRFPRGASGIASFVHVEDTATAVLAALEAARPGPVYNIVDDRPLSFAVHLDLIAAAVGAPPPRSMPLWPLRLAAPVYAALANARLALANDRAHRELGWLPRWASVAEGAATLADPARAVESEAVA